MIRPAPVIAATTLGIALIVSNPAAAQMFGGIGIDIGTPYPAYYGRIYGYPDSYASYPYYSAYSYPYDYAFYPYYSGAYPYSARNNGWAGVELAGTAVTTPFAVAANTQAPVTTGRSVATAQPYYGTRPSRSYRNAYSARRMQYSRSAENRSPARYGRSAVSGHPVHHGRSAY